MSRSWSSGQAAALVAAASVPSGYAWLRWKHPSLMHDLEIFYRLKIGQRAMEKLLQSQITFLDIFEKHANERPGQPCILYEEEMYTYAEVAWNANRTARWIRGSEPALKKGDVVCVLLYNGPTFVWTMLGLMKLGVVASFINFNLKGAALLHCIQVSNPKKLLIGSGNAISFWFSLNFLK